MSRRTLQQGDEVRYDANGRKMRGRVEDVLPFMQQEALPVLKRKRVTWLEREKLRKLPGTKQAKRRAPRAKQPKPAAVQVAAVPGQGELF